MHRIDPAQHTGIADDDMPRVGFAFEFHGPQGACFDGRRRAAGQTDDAMSQCFGADQSMQAPNELLGLAPCCIGRLRVARHGA